MDPYLVVRMADLMVWQMVVKWAAHSVVNMAAYWAVRMVASTAARRIDIFVLLMVVCLAEYWTAWKVWLMAVKWAAHSAVKVANLIVRMVA